MPDFDLNAYLLNLITSLQHELDEAAQVRPPIGAMDFENLWMAAHHRFFSALIDQAETLRLPEHKISRVQYFGKALKLQLFYSIRPDLQELNNYHALNDVLATYKRMFPE